MYARSMHMKLRDAYQQRQAINSAREKAPDFFPSAILNLQIIVVYTLVGDGVPDPFSERDQL